MRLIVDIQIGNDAMQSGRDLQHALREVIRQIHVAYPGKVVTHDLGRIRDENGNTVGQWAVGEDEP